MTQTITNINYLDLIGGDTMQYKLINWIKTAAWEGALIQDEKGRQYLTHGIKSWSPAAHRIYEVIPCISTEADFMRRWKESHPYDSILK